MPLSEKFPIGSRVGAEAVGATFNGTVLKEIPMRVVGYDGLKGVIVEFLHDHGPWKTGQATIMPAKKLTLREEVKYIAGEPQDGEGPAIGWMELGGLSVALTRDRSGVLLVAIEKSPDAPEDLLPIPVRITKQDGTLPDLWEGDVR